MTESKYNSVARTFYCKTLSKFPYAMERGEPEKAATAPQEREERREKENDQRSQDKMFIT